MPPRGPFRRRRLRLYALRTVSLVRHHYFSLVSAIILAGAGVLAVTGGDFGDGTSQAGPAVQSTREPLQTVVAGSRQTQARRLIYYIVDSEEQQAEMQAAMRGDMATLRNTVGYDYGQVVYLLLDTPAEESFWARFLNELVESAPREGYELRIIDLRQ
jgi:hypothetical protein